MIVFGLAQSGIGSQIVTPQSKARGIDVVARGHGVDGGAHFVGFAIAERGNSFIAPMCGKIKDEDVVLVVLQSGNQREQLAAARSVPVAQDDGWSAAQSRKKPAVPRAQPGNSKIHQIRFTRKAFHVDFTAGALRLDDAVHQESRNRRRGYHGENDQRHHGRKEFRIQLGWIAEFVQDGHS